MSVNLSRDQPGGNPAAPKEDRAGPPDAPPEKRPFARVPFDVLARTGLSDAAKVAYSTLQKWAWNGRQPTNAQLATACGWITRKGEPAVTKAKCALRELEVARLIARTINVREGYHVREALMVTMPPVQGGGRNLAHPRAESRPSGGRNLAGGGGRNLAPSEDRCRSEEKDLPRSGRGDLVPSTTTTREPAAPPMSIIHADPTRPMMTRGQRRRSLAADGTRPTPTPPPYVPTPYGLIPEDGSPGDRPVPSPEPSPADAKPPAEPGPPPPPDAKPEPVPLTAGQEAFLARVQAEGLMERFGEASEGQRRRWMTWFGNGGDRMLWGEVERVLCAKPLPPVVTVADSMEAILAGLGRRDHSAIQPFASRAASAFRDRKSFNFYLKVATEVATGQAEIGKLEDALRQATGPKAKHGGKVFVHAWKQPLALVASA